MCLQSGHAFHPAGICVTPCHRPPESPAFPLHTADHLYASGMHRTPDAARSASSMSRPSTVGTMTIMRSAVSRRRLLYLYDMSDTHLVRFARHPLHESLVHCAAIHFGGALRDQIHERYCATDAAQHWAQTQRQLPLGSAGVAVTAANFTAVCLSQSKMQSPVGSVDLQKLVFPSNLLLTSASTMVHRLVT